MCRQTPTSGPSANLSGSGEAGDPHLYVQCPTGVIRIRKVRVCTLYGYLGVCQSTLATSVQALTNLRPNPGS